MASLTTQEKAALEFQWAGFWARPKQLPPPGDWLVWLILAGRGFGKTRTGAEWVRWKVDTGQARRIALVGETVADTSKVMIEGDSGILGCCPPWNRPRYIPSKRELHWPNGAIAITYSADEPDQLRGPQHDLAWADELAKWRYADAWNQLSLGLRKGRRPQVCVTTTPRPTALVKSLLASETTCTTRGSTYENRGNMAASFFSQIASQYEGTRLGRQELYAEILDDVEGALWSTAQIEALRVKALPELRRVVVAIDPAVSAETDSDETGIVVAGLGADGHVYVIADYSGRMSPNDWAQRAVGALQKHQADRIIAEVNNGGALVEMNLRTAYRNVPYKAVHASQGKRTRAEPIAALYEQGKVHHLGMHAKLENQMCSWEPLVPGKSPDRVDALVWAISELMLSPTTHRDLRNLPPG